MANVDRIHGAGGARTASINDNVTGGSGTAGSTTTAPGVGDDADLAGKTVTIDQDVTVANILATNNSSIITITISRTINVNASGSFTCAAMTTNGITVTWNSNITGHTIGTSKLNRTTGV